MRRATSSISRSTSGAATTATAPARSVGRGAEQPGGDSLRFFEAGDHRLEVVPEFELFRRVDGDAVESGVSAQGAKERAPSVPEVLQTEEPELSAATELLGQGARKFDDGARTVRPGVASIPALGGVQRFEIPPVDSRQFRVPHRFEAIPPIPGRQRFAECGRLDPFAHQLADQPVHRRQEPLQVPELAEDTGGALADQSGQQHAPVEFGQRAAIGLAQPLGKFLEGEERRVIPAADPRSYAIEYKSSRMPPCRRASTTEGDGNGLSGVARGGSRNSAAACSSSSRGSVPSISSILAGG